MSFYLINPLNKYNILEAILFDKPLKYRQYTNGDFPHIKKLNFVGFLKYAFFIFVCSNFFQTYECVDKVSVIKTSEHKTSITCN